jgi:peptidoglycan/LPS O-acetylase OafA/YrhL
MNADAAAPPLTTDKKLPGLEGLRAIAVMLVVLCHQYVLTAGWMGVQIFFVLSGYLITGLLVRARDQPLRTYLSGFYGRRALRIFPLYYAVLALLVALSMAHLRLNGLREGLPFAATYTYNFWYASKATSVSYLLTHFWSLCVEEQFYLVWPFVIYLCPPRFTRRLLVTVIVMGPFVRAVLARMLAAHGATHLGDRFVALDVLSPTHFDAFAVGAYASLYPLGGSRRGLLVSWGLLAAGGLFLMVKDHLPWASVGYPLGIPAGYAFIWGYTLINICSAFLIDCLAYGKFLPRLFESRPLTYLGKISYGLYVLHYPVQWFVDKALPGRTVLVDIAVQAVITVALASLSYHFWEARFLVLKDRWFPSRRSALLVPVPGPVHAAPSRRSASS